MRIHVLNARLYRTCWLIAGVALIVSLLTLESPSRGPEPALPSSIDGAGVLTLSERIGAVAPERPAGSEGDLAAARMVQNQFAQLPGMGSKVQVQDFVARIGDRRVPLQNVYLAVPGQSGGSARAGVLVVAPRDTPRGVAAGTSSTAILLSLARQSATTRHLRPHLFVSTDGNTIGQAGMRWFLRSFSGIEISSGLVIDGLGDNAGDQGHLWARGMDNRHSLQIARRAAAAVTRAGGRPVANPGLSDQLLGLAVPQTLGDQGAAIAAGIPAVTLSARPDSPLRAGAAPTAERLSIGANAAADLLNVLDQPDQVGDPDASLELAGRIVRPTVARLVLLLLLLPVLVGAVEAAAPSRRKGWLRDALRPTTARIVAVVVVLFAAHLMSLFNLWPQSAAGAPPQPQDVPFGWGPLLGAALVGVLFAGLRLRVRRPRRVLEGQAPVALLVLAGALLALWLVSPFALLLALPAAHLVLVAGQVSRVWHVRLLALAGVLPLVLLAANVAAGLDRNLLFAAWYLLDTTASGARGVWGPLLGAVILGALWALATFAGDRAHEVAHPSGGPTRRRPRLRLSVERVPVGRRRHR